MYEVAALIALEPTAIDQPMLLAIAVGSAEPHLANAPSPRPSQIAHRCRKPAGTPEGRDLSGTGSR